MIVRHPPIGGRGDWWRVFYRWGNGWERRIGRYEDATGFTPDGGGYSAVPAAPGTLTLEVERWRWVRDRIAERPPK